MPQAGQIIPIHQFPHEMVVVNDNTRYERVLPAAQDDSVHMLFVFASPKGEDGVIKTISSGGLSEFVKKYGIGPFSLYGQPYLNAYNGFRSGYITGYCLRVTAEDATYSSSVLVALYKIDETGKMIVKFKVRTPENDLTDLDDMEYLYKSPTEVIADGSDDDGFTEVKLLTVAAKGKGIYGRKLQYRISSNTGGDKENEYKNYIFEVFENESTVLRRESFAVCFNEDAVVDDEALFTDGVIASPSSGSQYVKTYTNIAGFQEIIDAYNDANEDSEFTIDDFDVLLGVNKYTREAIDNYEIDTMSDGIVVPNVTGGIALTGGDDGAFAESEDPAARTAAINARYLAAFQGEIDQNIQSKKRFPIHLMLDANYTPEIKQAMGALCEKRGDCASIYDCGTAIKTLRSPITYVKNNLDSYLRDRNEMILPICGKVRDPYSRKLSTVTVTAALAYSLPVWWADNGGKHIPFAGDAKGIIDDLFVEDSIYPVYDPDIHGDLLDEMTEERINFATINDANRIVIKSQVTRQTILSNLSEFNNVLILLDVKRDLERMCAMYEYNFSEPEDIVQFNKDAETVTAKYADQQVRKIEASFDKNDWEATRGILHLYVDMEHKDLVKTSIIEIDVNRGSSSTSNE